MATISTRSLFKVTLLTGLTLGVLSAAHARDNDLRLPYDQNEDFIDLDDKMDNKAAPRASTNRPTPPAAKPSIRRPQVPAIPRGNDRQEPVARVGRERNLETQRPRLTGAECDGLRGGDYMQAYYAYTRIYERDGRIYIEYPTFTLDQNEANRARARQSQMPEGYYERQEARRRGPQGNFYSPAQEAARRHFESQGMHFADEDLVGDMVPVYVDAPGAPQPVLDQYGRQMIGPMGPVFGPATVEKVMLGYVTHDEAIRMNLYNNGFMRQQQPGNMGNVGMPMQQQMPNSRYRDEQPRYQEREPRREMPPSETIGGCVALPFLRSIEVERARTLEDAKQFLNDFPSDITRMAPVGIKESPTPSGFGQTAQRDPNF